MTRTLITARKALADAIRNTQPLGDDLAARLLAHAGVERFAQMEAEVAAIAATIPALQAEVDELEAQACTRCSGTGDYQAPTSHFRGGRPVCFACKGSGKRAR